MNATRHAGGASRPALLFWFFALTTLFAFVTFLRFPDGILQPSLYAEDGVWASSLYMDDAVATYWSARPDYLVVGNILLLHVAVMLNELFLPGAGVLHLPAMIALTSYAFFGVVAALPLPSLRAYLPLPARLAVSASVMLLPLGDHAFEVFGRANNAGYAFAYIALLLSLWRLSTAMERRWSWTRAGIDLGLLLCCATNPISFAIVGLGLALGAWHGRPRISGNDALLALAVAALAALTASRLLTAPATAQGEVVLDGNAFVLMGLARPLLYPLVWPVWTHLTHGTVLLLVLLGGSVVGLGLMRGPFRAERVLVMAGLAITTLAVCLQRPSLAVFLEGYQLSFPDRYFYAQNLMTLLLVIWSLQSLLAAQSTILRGLAAGMGGAVLLLYAVGAPTLFAFWEGQPSPFSETSFADQLAQAEPGPNPVSLTIPIQPDGWKVTFPREEVEF